MDNEQILDQVRSYADLAVHFDSQGFKEAALFYYNETASLIDTHVPLDSATDTNQASFKSFFVCVFLNCNQTVQVR